MLLKSARNYVTQYLVLSTIRFATFGFIHLVFVSFQDSAFRQNDDDVISKGSCSFDSDIFYIEDDLLPQESVFLKPEKQFNEVSTKNGHAKCQEILQKLRQTMEQKDYEISTIVAKIIGTI